VTDNDQTHYKFLPRDASAERGYEIASFAFCMSSVCLPDRPSVTFIGTVIT